MKVQLSVIALFCSTGILLANNAFTIHESLNSPVNVYYDTDLAADHIVLSIYPNEEFKVKTESELMSWLGDGYPICGAHITIISQAENDCLYIRVGLGKESIYGYIKSGSAGCATVENTPKVFLYEAPEKCSNKRLASYSPCYATIVGKDGDWFYVIIQNHEGKEVRGWLPPEMQCPSFLALCV